MSCDTCRQGQRCKGGECLHCSKDIAFFRPSVVSLVNMELVRDDFSRLLCMTGRVTDTGL
jgi:hypothetical protein